MEYPVLTPQIFIFPCYRPKQGNRTDYDPRGDWPALLRQEWTKTPFCEPPCYGLPGASRPCPQPCTVAL